MLSRVLLIAGAALALTAGTASATTMKVNTTLDGYAEDGKCGLREAVEAARQNKKEDACPKGEAKGDRIELKDSTYTLTLPAAPPEGQNQSGDLDIGGGPLTIVGEGSANTEIEQDATDRAIQIPNENGELRLERLLVDAADISVLAGFDALGGGIGNFGGELTLFRANVSFGEADLGGGIYSTGRLTADRSFLSNNDAVQSGGGLVATGPTTLKRTVINAGNVASNVNHTFGGGISIAGDDTVVKLIDSAIRGVSSDTTGGAFDAYGGAIYVGDGSVRLIRSEISGNGVSALTNGQDENGAGLYVDGGGSATVTNSTFFANIAGSPDGLGGSIYNAGTLTAQHTTFDAGVGPAAGDHLFTSGTSSIGRSIISGDNSDDPCGGAVATSLGFNVGEFDDPSCGYGPQDDPEGFIGFAGNLADNGGPTQTVALGPASDAVDFVPKGQCKTITKSLDQRGFVRPNKVGGVKQNCDAGAYELGAKAP